MTWRATSVRPYLLDSGDRVGKIEGIFSGTLSYIFNTFGEGQNFSDVVKQAKELGYTAGAYTRPLLSSTCLTECAQVELRK